MTTEDMKAELEAEGYRVIGTETDMPMLEAPKGGTLFLLAINETWAIKNAYRHLQDKRRLAELEAHNRRLLDVAREQQKTVEELQAFAKRVLTADYDPLAINNNWIKHASNVLIDLKTEAKKLIGEE